MPTTVAIRNSPPSADIYLSGLPSGTVKVWVWRSWANTQQRVRGDDQTKIVGTEARLEDYDFPVNRSVQYYAQCFAADGSELSPIAASTFLSSNLPNSYSAWISDPVAPSLSRQVELFGDSDGSRTYNSDVTYAQVIGQRAPVAIGGIRSTPDGWQFTLVSKDYDTSAGLDALFGAGGTILVRPHPDVVRHNTGLIYLSAASIVETVRHDIVYPSKSRSDWVLTGREVRPPGLAVIAPIREYKNLRDENATYQAVASRYINYLSALRG